MEKLLDVDTGGGEFLLSLKHPFENTSAMEGYEPNIDLCKNNLLPLGIDFRPGNICEQFPFEDSMFDIVINRHGDINISEFYRVLKPGGIFITQQVGAENDRELVEALLGKIPLPFPEQYLNIVSKKLRNNGFEILEESEHFGKITFYDVGALVWFAKIIEWEFKDFSVDSCLEQLMKLQDIIEKNGFAEGRTHRFMIVAEKKFQMNKN